MNTPFKEFKIAYCQMKGKGKKINHDTLFNGVDIKSSNNSHAKYSEINNTDKLIKIGVADGIYNSPNPQLASRYWITEFSKQNVKSFSFLRDKHKDFCDLFFKENHGSATTFAGVIINIGGSFELANIGDSRIYKITKNGEIEKLSEDHTIINSLLNTKDKGDKTQYASIYNGLESYLCADYMDDDYKINITNGMLLKGESLLIATDGLTDYLGIEYIKSVFNSTLGLIEKIDTLRKTIRFGKVRYDDVSIIVCERN